MAKNPLAMGYRSPTATSGGFLGSGGGSKRKKSGGAGRVAKGVVSAGIAFHGAYAQPQQGSGSTQKNWVQGAGMQEEGRQGRQARGGTRDKGRRAGGSSGKQ